MPYCSCLRDLLSHSELEGATEVHLHNYMIDLDWMAYGQPPSNPRLEGASPSRPL